MTKKRDIAARGPILDLALLAELRKLDAELAPADFDSLEPEEDTEEFAAPELNQGVEGRP